MKYLKLLAKLDQGNKDKELRMFKKHSERKVRDVVAEVLYNLMTIEPNTEKSGMNQSPYRQKTFKDMEEHKKLWNVKDKLLYSDEETIALGDEKFRFIKDNFKCQGFGADLVDQIVALDTLLEETDKQNEETAKLDYDESLKKTPLTVKEYYEGLGLKIIIKEDPKEKEEASV